MMTGQLRVHSQGEGSLLRVQGEGSEGLYLLRWGYDRLAFFPSMDMGLYDVARLVLFPNTETGL